MAVLVRVPRVRHRGLGIILRSRLPRFRAIVCPRRYHTYHVQGIGGIVTVSVGHCHPKVVGAVQEQMLQLQHNANVYLHPQISLYAQELAAKMPGDLKVRASVEIPPTLQQLRSK